MTFVKRSTLRDLPGPSQKSVMPTEFLNCSYASVCAGCEWLLKPAIEQHELKRRNLEEIWERTSVRSPLPVPIEVRATSLGQTRDRVDLMIDRRRSGTARLGLFDRFKTGIVDLQGCPQLSSALEAWLKDFRRFDFPISRGSVRLRVAPDGQRGVWLDFANLDVKALLDGQTLLESLLSSGVIVEIGQRRKRLVRRADKLKLDEPELYPWFETYVGEKPVALYATIGSFTQPGFLTNRILVDEVMKSIGADGVRAAEFGAGIGNFTLPLAKRFSEVDVYEVDQLALEGLTRSLHEQNILNVKIHSGNYQGERAAGLDLTGVDLLLVDPPRSGLMKFLDPLATAAATARPKQILYVSCFAESFAQDSDRLFEMGYKLKKLTIVDQFPQSRHYETVALFTRA